MTSSQIVAHTFTTIYPGIAHVLTTDIRIGHPIVNGAKIANPGVDPNVQYPSHAIWDTGATNTVITNRAAVALGLSPITKTLVKGVNSQSIENVYLVSIVLPNNVGVTSVRVTECQALSHPNDPDQCDVLLGMDIISHGDIAITNANGQTALSFRLPSIEQIDFNQSMHLANPTSSQFQPVQVVPQNPRTPRNQLTGVGRNSPCPCGSGKKYKHCHGRA